MSRIKIVARVLALASITLVSVNALAHTGARLTLEQLLERSEHCVVGRVVELEPLNTGPAGQSGIHTRVVVAVDSVLNGPATSTVEFFVHGGHIGNRRRVVLGQATFVHDEEVVVFLRRGPGGLWLTGMAQGKWRVADGAATRILESGPETLVLENLVARVRGAR